MSSRRGPKSKGSGNSKYNANKNKKVPADQQPPNHPQENFAGHRTFLARSLTRNDEDMAVLVDLNRTLTRVRQNIIDACGEEVLLDLGQGLFQLTPCERDLMVTPRPPTSNTTTASSRDDEQQQQDRLPVDDQHKLLCVDFLLRLKLRRRLLNRLARRLMRVAHAMDGEDVTAPVPPKYGDLRLHLDPEDMAKAQRHWTLREEARRRITDYRRDHPSSLLMPLIAVQGDETAEEPAKEGGEATKESVDDKDKEETMESTAEENNRNASKEETEQAKSDRKVVEEVEAETEKKEEESEETKKEDMDVTMGETDIKDSLNDDADAENTDAKMEDSAADKQPKVEEEKVEEEKVMGMEDVEMEHVEKEDCTMPFVEEPPTSFPAAAAAEPLEKQATETATPEVNAASSTAKETAATKDNTEQDTTNNEKPEPSTPSKVSSDAVEALLSIMSSPAKESSVPKEQEEASIATAPMMPVVGEGKEAEKDGKAETDDSKVLAAEKPKDDDTTKETLPALEQTGVAAEAKKDDEKTAETKADEKEDEKMDAIKIPASKEVEEESSAEPSAGTDKKDEPADGDDDDKMDVDDESNKAAESKPTGDEKAEVAAKPAAPSKIEEASSDAIKSEGETPTDNVESKKIEEESKETGAATNLKPDGAESTPMKAKSSGESPTSSPEKEPTSPAKKPLIELPAPRELSQLEKDFEILKDFVDAYEKEIDPITGEVSFRSVNDEEREEDYVSINRGFGIGATSRAMSLKEKEVEFQRWESAVLGRIPEAPTLDEIGMKNCVFLVEERRKRLRLKKEEEETEQANTKRRRTSSPSKRGKRDPDDTSSDDDDEDDKPAAKERNIGAVERKSPSKKSKEEEDEKNKEAEGALITKRMKPLPLVPYPSFYESDLRRVRLVHFDLMSHSIRNSAQQRVQTATSDYNVALRNSTQYFERKHKLEQQLNQLGLHYRGQMSKIKLGFGDKLAVERRRWQEQKAEYDDNRLKKLMPTRWEATPSGTPFTKAVVQKYREGTIPHVVGTCVADIVDAVEVKVTSNIRDDPFAAFSPPPRPTFETYVVDKNTGETMAQHAVRHQLVFKQELRVIDVKLNAAEEERKRTWKKLMKVKAELEQVNAQQNMPSYTPASRSSTSRGIEGYAPSGGVNTSDSKYSKARVSERIGNDGSVEPISKRKLENGLYQRPAGRGRKGMDWDAIRGVWIPLR